MHSRQNYHGINCVCTQTLHAVYDRYVRVLITDADLGKMLTDLLQNERRGRKLLGVTGAWSPDIFSILTT